MTAKEFIESKEWTKDTVHFSINDVIDLMQEYARIKCLEAIRNTRHKACEILIKHATEDAPLTLTSVDRDIMNIPNQDVMPEL